MCHERGQVHERKKKYADCCGVTATSNKREEDSQRGEGGNVSEHWEEAEFQKRVWFSVFDDKEEDSDDYVRMKKVDDQNSYWKAGTCHFFEV